MQLKPHSLTASCAITWAVCRNLHAKLFLHPQPCMMSAAVAAASPDLH
jgi:hypothetical protein